MSTLIKSYQDLEVWQLGIELTLTIYQLAADLPSSERFELSSQMRRAGVSVPSNIAEGHARRKPKPYLNHVHIALGSLAELETCIIVGIRLGYFSDGRSQPALRQITREGQMLHALAASLERRLRRLHLPAGLGLLAATVGGLLSAFS